MSIYRDLTEKGIKKLGNSIELSYSTIQKLVVKPLHISIINVFYHLSSLEGMLRNSYYYKVSCAHRIYVWFFHFNFLPASNGKRQKQCPVSRRFVPY
jgi:Anaphase-promoting complex, cyclosome, subunit 4